MSLKNSNKTIGNRTCDLPVCSVVPLPLRHRAPPNITDRRVKTSTRTKRFLPNFTILSEKFARNDNTINAGLRLFPVQ